MVGLVPGSGLIGTKSIAKKSAEEPVVPAWPAKPFPAGVSSNAAQSNPENGATGGFCRASL
ncbi:hypothetical protein [Methylomonas sp. AM2-LC]|uniref:hypothetical protein n=1 Tax=Methylomonas sp. AM2-LC TaxID=3153301 RepID=UPI003266A68A